jgi:hypothetical protein
VRFVGAFGGVLRTSVFDVLYVDDRVPWEPAVVSTIARYWTVPPVSADVSSHVVVVEADREDIGIVVLAFHVEPPSCVSVMTTWALIYGVGRIGRVSRITPDEIDVADRDARGFGVVYIALVQSANVVPALFDAATRNL